MGGGRLGEFTECTVQCVKKTKDSKKNGQMALFYDWGACKNFFSASTMGLGGMLGSHFVTNLHQPESDQLSLQQGIVTKRVLDP